MTSFKNSQGLDTRQLKEVVKGDDRLFKIVEIVPTILPKDK
jgi:hypothetical protein